MDVDKQIIKQDINFLEFPNWILFKGSKLTKWTIERPNGKYEILSPLGLPKQFDKVVIYFLLYKLFKEKKLDDCTLVTSRYEIAKGIFGNKRFGVNIYNRIMTSLKKWKALSIEFDGLFYEGDSHSIRFFSIVDEVILRKKTGELTIRFNANYVRQLHETKFYKLIDFSTIKLFNKAASMRLYEILCKSFKAENTLAINLQLLAEKLTFEKREKQLNYYASDVLRYLKPAINEINKKTDINIAFDFNKNTGICIFTKMKKQTTKFVPAVKDKKEKEIKNNKHDLKINECLIFFKTLNKEEQEQIISEIKQHPFIKYLPKEDIRIYAYMTEYKNWKPSELN